MDRLFPKREVIMRFQFVVLPLVAFAAGACATTSFTSSWRAPDAQPVVLAGKKVAALVMSANESTRRAGEDVLAREITARGAQGVPAHTLVTDPRDEERAKQELATAGVDGVVSMRVVGNEQQVTYTPGVWTAQPYYNRFWGGYYGYGWGAVYDPGYLRTDTIIMIETLVFSNVQDKLLWAGVSRTTNPSRLDSLISEVAGGVARELQKAGLLQD
jgi:hypothetical protein